MEFDKVPPIAKHLSVVFMLSFLGRHTVWYFLPIFFKQNIESVFLIGLMTSIPAALPLLLDIPMGNLVQRAGEKIVIFIGLVMNLMPGLFYITGIPVMLVFGKVFEGLVKTMIWNGGWTLSLKSANDDNGSESTSIFLLGVNLAAVIGPIIGGYLIASRGFELPFAIWVFSAWLGALVFYSYIGLEGERGFVESLEDLFHRKTYIDDYHHIKANWDQLRFPLILIFVYSIIFSFYWLAVPLLLDKIGAGYEMMGIIFGIAALPKIFQFVFGTMADRFGRLKVASVLAVLIAPLMVGMGLYSNVYIVGGLFLFARMLSSGLSPALHAFYDSKVPDELEGEITGFLELFKHSGQTLGPIIAGTAASIWSVSASFYTAAVVSAVLFLMCLYGSRAALE